MPTYLYVCAEKHNKEVTHSMTQEPDILCDICEKAMNRRPQTAGIKFYGKGFYSTDKKD